MTDPQGGEKYKQYNLDQVAATENTESSEAVKFVKDLISPFIRNSDAKKWRTADFYNSIKAIYANELQPIKDEISAATSAQLGQIMSGGVVGPQGRSMEEMVAESRLKARDITIILKGWVQAKIKLSDVQGSEEGKVTADVFNELQNMLPAVQELVGSRPENKEIFAKLFYGEGLERLTEADYQYLVDQIKPMDFNARSKAAIEGKMSGMYIGMMNPLERMSLARAFIGEKGRKEGEKFVEALVSTDMLTIAQGIDLLGPGVLDEGTMRNRQATVREAARKAADAMDANYYNNPARRLLTIKNAALVAGGALGVATILLNGAVHLMGDDKDWVGAISNEYIWLGGLGVAAAATKLSGRDLTALINKPGTEDKTKARMNENQRKFSELFSGNAKLEGYMEKGGLKDCLELRAAQKADGQSEGDFMQTLITKLKGKAPENTPRGMDLRAAIQQYGEGVAFTKVAETIFLAESLKIDQTSLKGIIESYRRKQGLTP